MKRKADPGCKSDAGAGSGLSELYGSQMPGYKSQRVLDPRAPPSLYPEYRERKPDPGVRSEVRSGSGL